MGNNHSASILTRTGGALDSFVSELASDVIYEKSLGSARFLKTVKCRHRNGYLVVKVFIKPDPGLSLRTYHRRLKIEREALHDVVNVYNYQSFVETDKAGYIIRQWIASSLYDRISTRPFLTVIEKKWIAFQLLTALRDARKRKISHGDIKAENVLVTSWNWVYLTDFASYKPTYLPLDNPSDFAYFFDTSGRRNCYIAPERFYTAEKNPDINAKKMKMKEEGAGGRAEGGKRDGKVSEAMDVFSAGCVLAELLLEGAPMFTLSQLFKYREGELDVGVHLGAIEEEGMRNLIKQMIALDSAERPTFDTLLHTSRGTIFPECFYSSLHNFISSMCHLPSPSPFSAPQTDNQPTASVAHTSPPRSTSTAQILIPMDNSIPDRSPLPTDSDRRLDRIWTEFESAESYLVDDLQTEKMAETKADKALSYSSSRPLQSIFPVEVRIPNRDTKSYSPPSSGRHAASEDGPALVILSLVCANIRNCSLPSSKVRGLDILLALSTYVTDEAKLDRLVPYALDLLHDESALVRASAIRTVLQVLMFVTAITPFNAAIFPEYILPHLRYVVHDPDVAVRCMFAQCIVPLADTATRYLEMGQALKAHGTFRLSNVASQYGEAQYEVSYEVGMEELQRHIQDQISTLLMDNSSVVKRALLHEISSLCIFLGRQKTNDVLLSHMITYLNGRDWLLRYAFFDSIADVAACLGGRSLEEYILPLMIQALSDVEEAVVAKVLASLTSLCELGLFQKMRIWELMSATLAFLYHPNIWIRQGAAAFIGSAAKYLPPTDVWCILYPSLRHFLRSEVRVVDVRSVLLSLKYPLPRQIYEFAVEWAMKSDKSQFWRSHRRSGMKPESPKEGVTSMRKAGKRTNVSKSEEDEVQLHKLEQLGMTPAEEGKLIALRDYILKLANATDSFRSRPEHDADVESLKTTADVELQKLNVVPQTIFLGSPSTYSESFPRTLHDGTGSVTPVSEMQRISRSLDHQGAAGEPFEDLRRRLATINGSASSVNSVPAARDRRASAASAASAQRYSSARVADMPMAFDVRPGSPTESVVSATNSVSVRHRFHVNSTDSQKAAPAIGSVRTNAVGVLEAPSKIRLDSSPEQSGWSSPMSITDTVRRTSKRLLVVPSYDGQDSGLNNILENMYFDGNREALSDFGPRVHAGPVRRRNLIRHSFSPPDGRNYRLDATLVSHLSSHSEAINGLAVSPDHVFFVSCSDDKTVKVWDTARLERNVTSKPRHTYGQHHARVTCICVLEGVHCFASAADDGSLHVVRVYVSQGNSLPKYGKLQVIREHRVDRAGEYITCMTHYNTDSSSNLLYATSHSNILLLDLKTMRVLQCLENPRHAGPMTSLCLDRKRAWLVTATLAGVLALWDLRFGLLLKSWTVGISSPRRPVRIRQCAVHPTKGRGRWVMVAIDTADLQLNLSGAVLIEVWDVDRTMLVEAFVTRHAAGTSFSNPKSPDAEVQAQEMTSAAAIAALVRPHPASDTKTNEVPPQIKTLDQSLSDADPVSRPPIAIFAMAVGVDFGGNGVPRPDAVDFVLDDNLQPHSPPSSGFLVTGSEDRLIRLWDLGKIERSTVLSGLEDEKDKRTFSTNRDTLGSASVFTETRSESFSAIGSNSGRHRPASIIQHQQNLLRTHQDCITSVVCVDSPFRGGIITGDRAGVIKVWRVDGFAHASAHSSS